MSSAIVLYGQVGEGKTTMALGAAKRIMGSGHRTVGVLSLRVLNDGAPPSYNILDLETGRSFPLVQPKEMTSGEDWDSFGNSVFRFSKKGLAEANAILVKASEGLGDGVVAFVGTTEEGQIDEISEIARLRDEYEKKGVSFYLHIDAAYGGYSRALYLDENNRFMGYEEMKKKIREVGAVKSGSDYPTKKLWEDYRTIPSADPITIDPHKMGYVPYAAGGIAIKDKRALGLISYFAAYVFDNKGDLSTNFGSVILEGSKAGATAAAVWAAHRLIPLNVTGYGQIVGRSIDGAEQFAKSVDSVKTLEVGGKEYNIQPLLVDPDFNIVCYAFNPKGGTNLEKMNDLNEKVYDATSYKSGPVYADSWITSKTELNVKDYGDAPLDFVKRLGISDKEWRKVGKVYVLRSCILHPWIANRRTYPERWARYLGFMKKTLEKVVN
jgi:hypothetical protein